MRSNSTAPSSEPPSEDTPTIGTCSGSGSSTSTCFWSEWIRSSLRSSGETVESAISRKATTGFLSRSRSRDFGVQYRLTCTDCDDYRPAKRTKQAPFDNHLQAATRHDRNPSKSEKKEISTKPSVLSIIANQSSLQRVEKLGLASNSIKNLLDSKVWRGACPTFSTRC